MANPRSGPEFQRESSQDRVKNYLGVMLQQYEFDCLGFIDKVLNFCSKEVNMRYILSYNKSRNLTAWIYEMQ